MAPMEGPCVAVTQCGVQRLRRATVDAAKVQSPQVSPKPFRTGLRLAAASNRAYRSYANVRQTFRWRLDISRFPTK